MQANSLGTDCGKINSTGNNIGIVVELKSKTRKIYSAITADSKEAVVRQGVNFGGLLYTNSLPLGFWSPSLQLRISAIWKEARYATRACKTPYFSTQVLYRLYKGHNLGVYLAGISKVVAERCYPRFQARS